MNAGRPTCLAAQTRITLVSVTGGLPVPRWKLTRAVTRYLPGRRVTRGVTRLCSAWTVSRRSSRPFMGAQLLAVSPTLALVAAAALSVAAIVSLLALEARLPASLRLVPRPRQGRETIVAGGVD